MSTGALGREAHGRTFLSVLGSLSLMGSVAMGCGAGRPAAPPPGDALDSVEAAQLFHYGNQLADSGDSIRAEQYLAAAMERGYPEAEVIPRLMVVCIEASRLSAALSYAEPYLERHTEDWTLRLLVASVQMGLNQPGAARGNLEMVLEQHPDEAEPHYLMAVLLRDRFVDVDASNTHFGRYLELAPTGDHAGEARLSMAGRYVPPMEPASPERHTAARHDDIEEPTPVAPPPGPRRLPAHDIDAPTEPGPSGT